MDLVHPVIILEPLQGSSQPRQHPNMVNKLPISLFQLFDNTFCIEVGMGLNQDSPNVELTVLYEVTIIFVQEIG